MIKFFFKRIWCPLFGHSKKTVKMPLFESWSWLEDESRRFGSKGSLHCASCGTMVGDYNHTGPRIIGRSEE